MAEKRTRQDIEAQLKQKSEAISSRFGALESKLPGSSSKVVKVLGNRKNWKVGAAIGAGLFVGVMVFGRRRSNRSIDYGEGLDRLSRRIAESVLDRLEKGQSEQEAVKEALHDVPPVVEVGEAGEGIVSGALRHLLRTSSGLLANEMAHYLSRRFLEEKESPPKD